MIADDIDGIRKAMEKLDWNRRVAEADAKLKAQQGDKNASMTPAPAPKPMFDEPGTPHFRGFFVEGLEPPVWDIEPAMLADFDVKLRSLGAAMLENTRSTDPRVLTHANPCDSNFCLDEYEQAWDEWDDATLDSGVTVETAPLFFWGKLE